MGVTFASFLIKGTFPVASEKLKRSLRGKEIGVANASRYDCLWRQVLSLFLVVEISK